MSQGWIGVDFDGTLVQYDHWRGPGHIGEPIPLMLERVKEWLQEGTDVRIFTARVSNPDGDPKREQEVKESLDAIESWCLHHLGRAIPVTCCKDFGMVVLWDDRCIQVETNTGLTIADVLHQAMRRDK